MASAEWNPRKPDVERFTEGDCHYLARAIHKLTGWPMMAFDDGDGDPDGNWHAFVRMPDGRLIDIEGVHDPEEFCAKWQTAMHQSHPFTLMEVTWGNLRHWGTPDFGEWTYKRARVMAERLLSHFGHNPAHPASTRLA